MSFSHPYTVAVIGAGPAGIFAAKELAKNGIKVFYLIATLNPAGWQSMVYTLKS